MNYGTKFTNSAKVFFASYFSFEFNRPQLLYKHLKKKHYLFKGLNNKQVKRQLNELYESRFHISGLVSRDQAAILEFRSSDEWQGIRKTVFSIYGRVCMCCGSQDDLAIDHIKPISKYFELRNKISNLQVLCKSCNSSKGNMHILDYRCEEKTMITDDQALEKMKALITGDTEVDHNDVDSFLSKLLYDLGYKKTSDYYDELSKDFWYA